MDPLLYYGMDYNPFEKGISYDRLYKTNDYLQMENRLDFIIRTRGIGLFLSNPGMGKTTSVRAKIMSLSQNRYRIIYVCMTTVTPIDFYRMLNDQLGLEESSQKSRLVRQIKEELKRIVEEMKMEVILVIDEVQYMERDIIKEFVMLMNFDYDSKDYCTLILLGQNDFLKKLKYRNLEAFTQRINISYTLTGMDENEVAGYVRDRLALVHGPKDLFSEDSYHVLFTLSNGYIRILNQLITKTIIVGCRKEHRILTSETIRMAQEEVFKV